MTQFAPAAPSVWPKQAFMGLRASGPVAPSLLLSATPTAPTSSRTHDRAYVAIQRRCLTCKVRRTPCSLLHVCL